MGFQSDYPDLSTAACRQVDIIFPRGSQSRMPDGSLPLDRLAALGYRGLFDSIAQTPTETSRMAGEYDTLARSDEETHKVAGEIAEWLTKRGLRVDGWPRPATRFDVHPFTVMSDVGKARSLTETINQGKRTLLQHEAKWLTGVLKAIIDR